MEQIKKSIQAGRTARLNGAVEPRKPIVTAIDTSTAAIACALTAGNDVLAQLQSLAERNHSVHAVSHIEQLYEISGRSYSDTELIAVGQGPGSYTGMRIAVTAAKTLAWIWNKPLVGVSSLEAVALGGWQAGLKEQSSEGKDCGGLEGFFEALPVQDEVHWVLPIMDARRGQVYTSAFTGIRPAAGNEMSLSGAWERWQDDGVLLMQNWADEIIARWRKLDAQSEFDLSKLKIWVTGDLTKHEEQVQRMQDEAQRDGVQVVAQPYVLEGRFVAKLGLRDYWRLQEQEKLQPVHQFTPNYTQLTEAEVNLKLKEQQRSE